ncbi:MAG: alanine--tRNA ligase, partial [Planctomycetota bacterium]
AERLNVTVYKDDDEAFGIWHEKIGLPTKRITRMDEDENFWPASAPSQGPDGVCGPCSEIYYVLDDGSDVEIWNLVFTQFERCGDPPDNLKPLPSKNIDTGMGLERTASVLQGLPTNYHIDSLMPIVKAASEVCGVEYQYDSDDGRRLRRITDHVRAGVFAIHENVYPDVKGANYQIRRLIRRAVLDGHQMGLREPFLHQLVDTVVDTYKTPYPEMSATAERVAGALRAEEESFFGRIDDSLRRISVMFDKMRAGGEQQVDGGTAADLYTSGGVPPELLQTMAEEQSFGFDWDGYHAAMQRHAIDSGKGQKALFDTGPLEVLKESLRETVFVGYDQTQAPAIIKGMVGSVEGRDQRLEVVYPHAEQAFDQVLSVVLDQTPFYGESGGQKGDCGILRGDGFEFVVTDTQKHSGLFIHIGHLTQGEMRQDATCTAIVDTDRRDAMCRAHSATHVLHFALQQYVGEQAQQRGSLVEPDRLRFDYSSTSATDDETVAKVEQEVLSRVRQGDGVQWETVSLDQARTAGAMMLFGEKYPDPVRMVSIGQYSKELCGGTHVTNTSDIGVFELISDQNLSAGTRRVMAQTGAVAQQYREIATARGIHCVAGLS